ETTLTVSLADAPEWACSNAWVETFCPETLRMPVTLRAVTADGRLDAELPAELSLDVATPASATDGSCGAARTAGEIEGITLTASYLGVAAGEPAPGVIPPLDANMGLWLRVSAAPPSPDGTSAEVGVLGVERRDRGLTPPLDATAVPAGASCFGFAPFEGVETE
ncbi:MAG TPA: hypothetical protein VMG12_06935, partial [Polyangiaceae bacterium]|nr:hypothetical protein [Polyangiaceae bacterium]